MGMKRKSRRGTGDASKTSLEEGNTKLLINSYEDVANSDDEFHIAQDKILLEEGPARKRMRQLEEEDEFLQQSEEEVLALPSSPSGSELDEEVSDGEDIGANGSGEVLGDSDVEPDPEEQVDKEGWGTSRKNYYDADVIETEADALEEEEEALRLQRKQLQGMTEADFGFDENEWLDSAKADQEEDSDEDRVLQEVLPQIEITDDMSIHERNEIMAARYPEFGPLSQEFLNFQSEYDQTRLDALAAQRLLEQRQARSGVVNAHRSSAVLRWTALGTYLAALSMYFAILTSGPFDPAGNRTSKVPAEMRNHSIMESLMRTRTVWHQVKDLKVVEPTEEAEVSSEGDLAPEAVERTNGATSTPHDNEKAKKKKPRKSKAQKAAEEALTAVAARRAERLRKSEANLDKISQTISRDVAADSPSQAPNASIQRPADDNSDHDFGDVPVTVGNLSSTRRKKSLQFYASQIAQKSNKRSVASRDAGGDTDIPYRERFKDRQARLNAEAEARGKKEADVLGDSSDEDDARVAAELRNGANGDVDGEDYYQSIASATAAKKADKAARREALRLAASQRGAEVREVEEVGPDGKRAISYAIQKNKGLTPRRKKEVRNPRVKKRKRYEDKMKKLGSIRKIYKGGEGRGGYKGETTGIKSGLVRSVKL